MVHNEIYHENGHSWPVVILSNLTVPLTVPLPV